MRLLYMLNVQSPELRALTPGTRVLPWRDGLPLKKFVEQQFPKAVSEITPREGRLHPHFAAANLNQMCNLRIQWTDSLEDHLRLDRRTNALRVFPHKRCLLQMLRSGKDQRSHATYSPLRRKTLYGRRLVARGQFNFWPHTQ